ncbi:hypothetical protein BpHYR1_053762 [Brachionus plicatilis]|uniref:Uncharacterized protein n=1 Tax=Brachionus plicatilis TaxID=10195 RepID=A0A3M7QL79_BRAPC|nr:hypothetical protein BpHYR1_053762 [Brachionus plicatilis]
MSNAEALLKNKRSVSKGHLPLKNATGFVQTNVEKNLVSQLLLFYHVLCKFASNIEVNSKD